MKYINYIQKDSMDCGAACLQIIAKYYGSFFLQEKMRSLCHITRNGVSLLGVSDAAEAIGFRSLGVKITWEQLKNNAILPCIIHWNQNHFVVVLGIKTKGNRTIVVVSDPAHGVIEYSEESFLKSWIQIKNENSDGLGIALLLTPKSEFYKTECDKESHIGIIDVLKYLRFYKRHIFQICLAMLLASIISIIFPFLTQSVVDTGIGNNNIGFIVIILAAQLGLIIGQVANGVIKSWLMLHVTTRLSITLISDFLSKLMRLPIAFFDSKNIGDILQRINDYSRIQSFLTGSFISTVMSALTFIAYSFVMATFNYRIIIVFIFGSAIYISWVQIFMKRRRKLDYMKFQEMSVNQSNLIQLVNGMQEIKLNNCEKAKRWEWENIQARLFNIGTKTLTLGQLQNIGGTLIDQIKNILISFFSAIAVIEGEMTLGEMLALQYIMGQLNAPLYQFVNFLQSYQDAKISIERMSEIHEKEDEEDPINCMYNIVPKAGEIELQNIVYQYDGPRSPKVINEINLKIPPKKTTAIVGVSGSGKTTLLKMLLGFYTPTEGTIKLDGHDLNTYSIRDWRKNCGVVMQDGYIFSDTIANNIGVSDSEIDYNRVKDAAKQASINEFIESLPMGYNTKIGADGVGLSSGQKQRLLIARAIYKQANYLFFDEATNALDTNNEKNIMENFGKVFKDKTVIIVAHRLSTIRNADNIVVIKDGQIAEFGDHNTLINLKGIYYELIKNQL